MTRMLPLLTGLALLGGAASAQAAGCSPDACVPRTGNWTAPSPQKLTSPFGPTKLTMKVAYRRNGKIVRSRYGNSVERLGVYLRYFCANENSPWVETGFTTVNRIRIPRSGKVKVTIPASFAAAEHTLSLVFKRTTFSGRLAGTATNSEGNVCSTSVSFSGKLKT